MVEFTQKASMLIGFTAVFSVIFIFMSFIPGLRSSMTILTAIFTAIGGFMLLIVLLNNIDNTNVGDDLDFWYLNWWRWGGMLTAILCCVLVSVLLWRWGMATEAIIAVLLITALYAAILAVFVGFKIRRRQKMIGIWRPKENK